MSLVLASTIVIPGQALAATSSTAEKKTQQSKINGEISKLKDELSEVSGDYAEILGQLDTINNRKAGVEAQVADLEGKMADAQSDLDAATARLAKVQAQLDTAQAKLKTAQDQLADSDKRMTDQALDAYMGVQKNTNMAEFVLRSDDIRDASAASEYMSQVVQDRASIVEQNRELQGQADDAKISVQKIYDQAQADRETVVKRQNELSLQKGQLDGLYAQVQSEADAQAALLAQVEVKRVDIQSQMDSLQAQSDSIAMLLRALSNPGVNSAPTPTGKGVLQLPVLGARLSSPFGMRLDPVMNRYQLHAGQDLAVPTGTQIRAAADGVVVSVLPTSSSGGYGNYTCISHGNGLATCYAHQSQFLVTKGQTVKRGQVIGLSGSTGFSTGPHLHFEVRVNGTPVNPLGYL